MDTISRIKALCKEKNITVQQLEIELREKPSSISRTTSNSKAEKLYKIAQFFNVSIEYLITGKNPDSGMSLSFEEMDIIKNYRKASEGGKDAVCKLLDVKRQDTDSRSKMVG